jgi:hypothetical protein
MAPLNPPPETGPVPVSRQEFLKGIAGVAAMAGAHNLWNRKLPARQVNSASSEHLLARQQLNVKVDLARSSGKTLHKYLYGYATGALLDGNFRVAADRAAEKSARTLAPALIRLNTPVQQIIQSVFENGTEYPNWAPFADWIRHRSDFLGDRSRLVFGIGPNGNDTSIPPATWAAYAKAVALHFQRVSKEITYWEVGNECDPMGAAAYSKYFNAIADGLHAVNPAYQVGGPVASWWNGIDLPAFISYSGARIGFIDFHSYPVNDTDYTSAAYRKAATFADIRNARQALAGTVAARLPIGLLEYNMNGNEQPDGTFGLPGQGAITGAVYAALLLTQAFFSDSRFTMGALWDLVANSNYGVIGNAQHQGNYHTIDEQGWYLRQAARLMPGRQVAATTTLPDLQVLATRSGQRFSVQLVNYSLTKERTVAISVEGRRPGSPVTSWELSARHPAGRVSSKASLPRVSLPSESIVILNGLVRPP